MARDSQARSERESFWRRMVEGQKGSALTVRAWCGQHDLRESLFYWWRRQLARRDHEAPPAAFVPVQVTAGQSATDACERSCIEIVLPNGGLTLWVCIRK